MGERYLPTERSTDLSALSVYRLIAMTNVATQNLDYDTISDVNTACKSKLQELRFGDPEYDETLELMQWTERSLKNVSYDGE